MGAVEILLLFVVGFSVLVFLILDSLDSLERSRKSCDSESKTGIGEPDEESVHQEDEKIVGGNGEAEMTLVSENLFQEGAEGKETENLVNASGEKSDICSGNNGDNIRGKRGIGDVDEGEGGEALVDDWEGIERTELEKIFGEAIAFESGKNNADGIDEDVKLQLYGLQKVALQGPCRGGSQPMALNVSARAKWTAWQKLGNMSREMAMEKYIDILSEAVPGWQGNKYGAEDLISAPQDNKHGAEVRR